jgi:hypothetical protein
MDAASIATKRRDDSTVSFNVYLVEDLWGLLLESAARTVKPVKRH